MKETVPFKGVLAHGKELVNCQGIVDKTTLRNETGWPVAIEFSNIRILNVSEALPDGVYTFTGPSGQRRMRLRNGSWEEVA
jgi:hypothetical protein